MDVDEFRSRMHVLAVDDDGVSLMLIEKQLRYWKYNVTTVMHPETALEILRARKDADQFDLVITDVHMPGMDGFKLLELIGLEMDIPVLMLSANDTFETMTKGIKHGARDYLVKPVCLEQLKNLWIHVVRKNMDDPRNYINNCNDDDGGGHHKVQYEDSEGENGVNNTVQCSRKKKKDKDNTREDKENTSNSKRQRIQWSGPLHRKFVEVVHRIGIDKAVPKRILEMMNVDGLAREHVASHLQKYRLYLQKLSAGTFRSRNPFTDETMWSEGNPIGTNGRETFENKLEHGRYHTTLSFAGSSNSSNPFARMNSSAAFGTHSMLPTQSVQLMNKRNLGIPLEDMGSDGYGSNLPQTAVPGSQHVVFPSSSNSNTNIGFPSATSGSSFANISNSMPFNTSFPSGTSSNSFANIRNGSPPLEASIDADYCPLKTYASLCASDADPLHGNRRQINRLSRLAASSGHMSAFQNQMAAFTRTTTPMSGFTDHVAPFNIGNNTYSTMMPTYNSTPVSASSVISTLPDLHMNRDVMPNQMLNGGSASGCLVDQEAPGDQLNCNDESLVGTSSAQNGISVELDDFLGDWLNQDIFKNGDAFMDGDSEFAP